MTPNTKDIEKYPEISINPGDRPLQSTGEIPQSQEKTRARIALTFTQVFLFLVSVAFVLPTLISFADHELIPQPIDYTKDMVTTIASILAGPFGFIVGFYFKKDTK